MNKKLKLITIFLILGLVVIFVYKQKNKGLIFVTSYPASISDFNNGKFAFATENGLVVIDASIPDSFNNLVDDLIPMSSNFIAKEGYLYFKNQNKLGYYLYKDSNLLREDITIPYLGFEIFGFINVDNEIFVIYKNKTEIKIFKLNNGYADEVFKESFKHYYTDEPLDINLFPLDNNIFAYSIDPNEPHSTVVYYVVNFNKRPLESEVLNKNDFEKLFYGIKIKKSEEDYIELSYHYIYDYVYKKEDLSKQQLENILLHLGFNNNIFVAIDNGLVMINAIDPENFKLEDIAMYEKKYNEDRPTKIIVKNNRVFLIHPSGIEEYTYQHQ